MGGFERADPSTGRSGVPTRARINAAGRLWRADAGLELMLTEDERAEAIAAELSGRTRERRARRAGSIPPRAARRGCRRAARGAGAGARGEGWHAGVIGIVASRLVERFHRPGIVIALDARGGEGHRAQHPGFDLLAALEACGEHLETFGGHRVAAGLTLRAGNLGAFREAFAAHATALLGPDELRRTQRIDAMVGGVGLGLELAEELGGWPRSGWATPGCGCWSPRPGCSDVRTMGEGKHARFSLHSGAHRALGVAFGRSSLGRRGGRAGRRRGAARGQPLERLGRAPRRPARALPARCRRA